MVTVQNIAADKLDWYIDPSVTMRVGPGHGSDAWNVRLTVHGPEPGARRRAPAAWSRTARATTNGIHRALVAVYLPAAAFDIRIPRPRLQRGRRRPADVDGRQADLHRGGRRRRAWPSSSSCPATTRACSCSRPGGCGRCRVTLNGVADRRCRRSLPAVRRPHVRGRRGRPPLRPSPRCSRSPAPSVWRRPPSVSCGAPAARPLVAPRCSSSGCPSLGLVLLLAAGPRRCWCSRWWTRSGLGDGAALGALTRAGRTWPARRSCSGARGASSLRGARPASASSTSEVDGVARRRR